MTDKPTREVITIDGTNVVLKRDHSPITNGGVIENEQVLRLINIFDEKFKPSNMGLADGKPLRLYDAKTIKIDLSKRSSEDMGFWHRNVDAHEIIFCVRGALNWETELGTYILRPGDMLLIPRGISHRSMLCEESAEENVLVELKIGEQLTYIAD